MHVFIYYKNTVHVSSVHRTHHQEYIKHKRSLLRYYDLYQRLQLQFYVLLMMGAMDTRNMYSIFVVNEYLHTVAFFGTY